MHVIANIPPSVHNLHEFQPNYPVISNIYNIDVAQIGVFVSCC